MKIKKGDKVKVIYGKEKGKESTVEKAFPREYSIVVSGVNVVKKHVKARGQEEGGIIDITKKIPISRVLLVCPKCGKAARVGYFVSDGKKLRQCKKCRGVF